jgi:membrane-associated protein
MLLPLNSNGVIMEFFNQLLQYILHIDTYLIAFVVDYGAWAYAILFVIIFCETGLVITPFLPGDSLLFAAGSIAANSQNNFNIQLLFIVLLIASILGNKVNYLIGKAIGPRIFNMAPSRFLNRQHLAKAHTFYEKHGGKTLIIARFLPIIRTFAPFIAGVSFMSLSRFTFYNLISGFLWVSSLLFAGYYFGSLPFIQENFSLVVYGIVALSLLPPAFAFFLRKAKDFA